MATDSIPIRQTAASLRLSTAIVYVVFAFTGVAVVLPGALLPVLLATFHLRDAQGGLFLFAYFVGSASGALLARGKLPHSMARGATLTALGAVCLAYAENVAVLVVAIVLFGLGLGVTMTSASLLQSRNYAATRAAELTRLNLVWSLGATAGPWIALRGAHSLGIRKDLLALAACSLAIALLAVFSRQFGLGGPVSYPGQTLRRRSVVLLLLAIPLATGIEAAAGGWLTTYAERLGDTLNLTVAAGTCFWGGMLMSRFAQSFRRIAAVSERPLLLFGPALMVFGLVLVLWTRGPWVLCGAALIGLGVGPMYPLLLAYSLRAGEKSNIAFAIAGCGSSLLPMLTGSVSGAFNLRYGLCVPLVGAVVMLVSNLAMRSDLVRNTPGATLR